MRGKRVTSTRTSRCVRTRRAPRGSGQLRAHAFPTQDEEGEEGTEDEDEDEDGEGAEEGAEVSVMPPPAHPWLTRPPTAD